jgi:hypothetical protein
MRRELLKGPFRARFRCFPGMPSEASRPGAREEQNEESPGVGPFRPVCCLSVRPFCVCLLFCLISRFSFVIERVQGLEGEGGFL